MTLNINSSDMVGNILSHIFGSWKEVIHAASRHSDSLDMHLDAKSRSRWSDHSTSNSAKGMHSVSLSSPETTPLKIPGDPWRALENPTHIHTQTDWWPMITPRSCDWIKWPGRPWHAGPCIALWVSVFLGGWYLFLTEVLKGIKGEM